MTTHHEDLDRIARYLDGAEVPLSAEQTRLADEFRADERAVGPRLDVEMPAGAMARLSGRLGAALERESAAPAALARRMPVRWYWAAVGSAIAAALVLAALAVHGTFDRTPAPSPGDSIATVGAPGEELGTAVADAALYDELAALSQQVALEKLELYATDEEVEDLMTLMYGTAVLASAAP